MFKQESAPVLFGAAEGVTPPESLRQGPSQSDPHVPLVTGNLESVEIYNRPPKGHADFNNNITANLSGKKDRGVELCVVTSFFTFGRINCVKNNTP